MSAPAGSPMRCSASGCRRAIGSAVLAYNCVEWLEIYAATAKAGLVAVPINFRLVGPEIRYIVENCEAGALIVQDELIDAVEAIRDTLPDHAGQVHPFRQQAPACRLPRLRGLIAAGERPRAGA